MRVVPTLIMLSMALQLTAQNGYVILNESDEVIDGYLKYFQAAGEARQVSKFGKRKKIRRL